MELNLQDQKVIVTAGAQGIGLAITETFIKAGAQVHVCDINEAFLADARARLAGAAVSFSRTDVARPEEVDAMFADLASRWDGRLDVLVNNAGIGALAAVEAQPMEQVREIFDTNTLGSIAMTQAVIPQMRQRGAGVIVNVTSSVTLRSLPLLAVYTASKAAVNAFTESVALELASVGVQARLVLPGRAPQTRFAENARPRMEGAIPDAYGALAAQVFSNFQDHSQITHASDVAEAVWLASTEAGAPMRIAAGEDAVEWMRSASA